VGVVPGTFLRVREDFVGGENLGEESGGGFCVAVIAIGVEEEGFAAVGFFYSGRGVALVTQVLCCTGWKTTWVECRANLTRHLLLFDRPLEARSNSSLVRCQTVLGLLFLLRRFHATGLVPFCTTFFP